MKSIKSTKPKRPRGRPAIRMIEQIDAPPEEIVKAVFRAADRKQRGWKLGKDRGECRGQRAAAFVMMEIGTVLGSFD